MKALSVGTLALMFSIILWGILIGGVVYSHIIYFPVFLGDLPESSSIVTGRYRLDESVFWMSLHPLLILSLIASLVLNWKLRRRRNLILTTMIVYLGAIVATGIYFVPELIAFSESSNSAIGKTEWMARGWWWQRWSWLRGSILFIAYFPLMLALVTTPAEEKTSPAATGH